MKKTKLLIPLLIVALLAGCGAKSSDGMGVSTEESKPQYDMAESNSGLDSVEEYSPMAPDKNSSPGEMVTTTSIEVSNISEKKIIDNASLTIETLEFDKAIDTLNKTIADLKGYMQTSNVNHPGVGSDNYKTYRNGNFVVRVPKENFQNFLKAAGNMGVITNENSSSEDITKQFYDTETRLKVYEAQEARYLELLNEAKTMEDILTIERQLTEVRYNIEYLAGYKNQMKDLVDYGTVNISLYEVDEPTKVIDTPKNLGQKIVNAFKTSLESLKYVGTSLILLVVAVIPYAVIIGLLAWAGFFVYNKVRKNKK